MKRALIVWSLSAIALAGCSGGAKTGDDQSAANTAAAGPAKPNPWSSDGAGAAAADAAAKPAAPVAPKDPAAPSNPWAKDPPPGSQPSPAPVAKDDAKP